MIVKRAYRYEYNGNNGKPVTINNVVMNEKIMYGDFWQCIKCGFQQWNIINYINKEVYNILTCDEVIIKGIIE